MNAPTIWTVGTGVDEPLQVYSLHLNPDECVVIWDRGGHRRLVPRYVIKNARSLYEDALMLLHQGIIVEIPRECQTISWDQCKEFQTHKPVHVHVD